MTDNENLELDSRLKLDQEAIDKLKAIDDALPSTRKALEALKRMGINVKELEEHLNWAETVSSELKETFI